MQHIKRGKRTLHRSSYYLTGHPGSLQHNFERQLLMMSPDKGLTEHSLGVRVTAGRVLMLMLIYSNKM